MIKTLWEELQEQGFTGSYQCVWAFVRNWPLPPGMTPTASSSAVPASTRRGAPATRTRLSSYVALAPEARGTERHGCRLSSGAVSSVSPTRGPFCARPGFHAADP